MRKQYLWYGFWLWMVTLLLFPPNVLAASSHPEPAANQGELNLRQYALQHNGPVLLNGEWTFHWNVLLAPDEDEWNSSASSIFAEVPATWTHYANEGQSLPGHGYATYRLLIHLHEEDQERILSFYMPSVATAYDLWVNGQWLAGNGTVGTSRQAMTPRNVAKIVSFQADGPQIELLLHVSNFHQRKAGLWEPIALGTEAQIVFARERNVMQQSFVVGCIFMIGMYHLILFLFRRRELSPLLLALACFGVGIRTLLLKDTLLVQLYPQLDWEVAVRFEYFAALGALICFLLFAKRELLPDMSVWLTRLHTSLLTGYSIFVLLTPARLYTMTFWMMQVLVLATMTSIVAISILGILRKREGAWLNFAAMLVLFASILNDFLYYSHWIESGEWTSVGLLFYLIVQSVHLARRFTGSFTNVEKLSRQLQQLNQSLELQVEQRTAQWQQANNSLQKIEASRRRLLASVSHELNTPLTIIQGYIKAMIDGVIPRHDTSYLRTIYRDTQMMAHIIRDLQELSLLESDALAFRFTQMDMRSYLQEIYEEQRPIVEGAGVQLSFRAALDHQSKVLCRIDPIRIKQAIRNLFANALRYTDSGGGITLEASLHPAGEQAPSYLKIGVRNTGAGISEADLPHLFQRFYKGKASNPDNARGAGLGLVIFKEIIERHEGTVHAESEQGAYSLFTCMLPISSLEKEDFT